MEYVKAYYDEQSAVCGSVATSARSMCPRQTSKWRKSAIMLTLVGLVLITFFMGVLTFHGSPSSRSSDGSWKPSPVSRYMPRALTQASPAISATSVWPLFLQTHENKVTSQNGEDGILEFIFQNIGTTNKYYVEFGVQDGFECNTRFLREHYQFHGLLMDSGPSNSDINLQQEFIKSATIRSLFEKYEVPFELDLLSIDIDSTDLWIWRKLCGGEQPYRPRVVAIEYNMNFALYDYSTNPDDPSIFWEGDGMFGASLSALYLAGRQLGYTMVYTDANSVNAFFLRDDLPGVDQMRLMLPLEALHRRARPLHKPMSAARRAKLVDYHKWSTANNLPTEF